MKKLTFVVGIECSGQRLDKYLGSQIEIGSRSRALQLLNAEKVHVNSRIAKPALILKPNDQLEVQIPPPPPTKLMGEDIPLSIVYEDTDLLVVNKPAGLVVHPSVGHRTGTLVNALMFKIKDFSLGIAAAESGEERPGIVHRLDKDTSGLLVVAKNDFTLRNLVGQFQKRSIHRIYRAISIGCPMPSSGRIESKLARNSTDRKRYHSVSSENESGKIAITNYETVQKSPQGLTHLKIKLETGRTHQIRVHLLEAHTPIVGDFFYAKNQLRRIGSETLSEVIKNLNRVALHASELGFEHPRSKDRMMFHIPLAKDLIPLATGLGWQVDDFN